MPYTCLQTVDISYKGAPFVIKALEICPIAEIGTLGLKKSDGSTILWLEESTIQWLADGTIKTWKRRPTLKEAITTGLCRS
jgi:hypothetical protein